MRAVSIYLLRLRSDSVVWDIGAGTGSVAIEAGRIAHRGSVYAVERDPDSIGLLRRNAERLAGCNVQVVHGEAPRVLERLPDPDSVFVGGSGGQLAGILDSATSRLKDDGRLVVNLAALERTSEVFHRLKDKGMIVELSNINASRGKEMSDGTLRLEALNPVFIVAAQWKEQTP